MNNSCSKLYRDKYYGPFMYLCKDNNISMDLMYGTLNRYTNQLFEENKGFESSFYQIEVQVITNPSNYLEKNTPNT